MIRIAIDAMGGDYAPDAVVEGAAQALAESQSEVHLVLIGIKDQILASMAAKGINPELFTIVDTPQVITMDDSPTKALREKPNSSIAVGIGMVKAKKVDVFASAGNTGAMLVGSMFILKPIEGVLRPTLVGHVPKENLSWGLMLDVGANIDVKPETLEQFAELGSLYASHVLHIDAPKVGLLNLGEEEKKGSIVTQATYQLLKQNSKINFIGNIEGRDLMANKADVMVCDGLVGNLLYKALESIHDLMEKSQTPINDFFGMFNYENVGGMPIVGVEGNVIVGHGMSSAKAIKSMIMQAKNVATEKLSERVKSRFRPDDTN